MKILIFLACVFLWRIGGTATENWPLKGTPKKPARVMLLPACISLSFIFSHPWLAIMTFGNLQSLRIGYGESSALASVIKIDWQRRAVAGFIYGFSGAITLFVLGQWQEALFYIILNTCINGTLNYLKANDFISEFGAGMGVASLIWLIR